MGESIRVLSDEDVLCSGGELASLGDCDVFLWHGHGGYVRELGSYLVSREKPFWERHWIINGWERKMYFTIL